LALWRLLPDSAQDTTALDLATAHPHLRTTLLDRFADAGVALRAFDATSDVGVPTVLCLVADESGCDEIQPELGSGCHLDPTVALARAASEAAQVRLTRIAGARDDFLPESYETSRRAVRARVAREWLHSTLPGITERDCRALPARAGNTLRQDLKAILARLAAAAVHEAVWVDLTDPEIGVPVVRVVVPGLEGPATPAGGGYVPGERALRAIEVADVTGNGIVVFLGPEPVGSGCA
jgi:ribosomal protein S12 methylthiotransferase accessory factor